MASRPNVLHGEYCTGLPAISSSTSTVWYALGGGARISTGTFPSRHLSTEFASAQAVTTPFGMREEPHIRYQGEHPGAESISDTSWSTKTPQASGRWVAETADAAGIVMQREMEELDAGVLPPGYEKMLGTLHRVLKKFSPGMEDEIALEEGDQVLLNFTFEDGWGQGTNLTSLHQGVFPLKCLSSNALLEKVLTEAYLTDLEKTSREIATSMHAPSSNDPSLHDLQFVPSYTSDSDTLDRIRAPPTTPAFPASPDTHYRKPVKHPSIYSNHTQEDSTFTSVTSSPVSPIPPVRSSSFDALVRPQIVLPRSMHTTISPTLPARLSLRRVQTSSSSSSSASSPRLNPIATPPTVEAIAAISEASLRKALERDPDTFDRDTVGLFRNLDEALVKRRVTLGKYFKERSRIVEVLAVRGKVVDLAF
ncbi:hypothetical protein BC829DRAFT_127261 [Chytridium lagenaria]|nr:hypothetical protein BC829DRAFT_127261 [Chytridium lagenaria]